MLESIARNLDEIGLGVTIGSAAIGVAMIFGGVLGGTSAVGAIATAFFGGAIFMVGGLGGIILSNQQETLLKKVKERKTQATAQWARTHRYLQAE